MRDVHEKVARLAAAVRADTLLADGDRVARDQAIAEAEAAGMGVREIATWAAMSPAAICGILGRAAARRQAQTPPGVVPEAAA